MKRIIFASAPLAISVIQPEELICENIVRAEDLLRAVPALVAANNGGANTAFFLCGSGNFTANSYSDPAIAFNYDGGGYFQSESVSEKVP